MEDWSEQAIRHNCPHCDRNGFSFKYFLEESQHFCVVCDAHPLIEGHLLLIPKRHTSCIGEYTSDELSELRELYHRISSWVSKEYGPVATFEHGKIGQTVFHSHVHIMPFSGSPEQIIPEGKDKLRSLPSLESLRDVFQKEGQYLFFSMGTENWIVDTNFGAPRFFRDRFAQQLGVQERANWKETRKNPQLMAAMQEENERCQKRFFSSAQPSVLFE